MNNRNISVDNDPPLGNQSLRKKSRQLNSAKVQRIDSIVSAIESIDIAMIYAAYFKPFLIELLTKIGQYFLFPIFALAKCIEMGLAWRQAYIDKKTSSLVHALVETVSAIALSTAVVGGFVAAAAFAVASSLIFSAVGLGKTIHHLGKSLFFAGAASREKNLEKKETYKTIAKRSVIAAIAGAMATVATIGVFLLGKAVLAPIGLFAAFFATVFAIHLGIQSHRTIQRDAEQKALTEINEKDDKTSSMNTLDIHKRMSQDDLPHITRNNHIEKQERDLTPHPSPNNLRRINIKTDHIEEEKKISLMNKN
jgi:hypothetical protein